MQPHKAMSAFGKVNALQPGLSLSRPDRSTACECAEVPDWHRGRHGDAICGPRVDCTRSIARLKLDRPHHAHLETEVAQGGAQVVLDGNRLRLKQLAVGQQHPKLLAA